MPRGDDCLEQLLGLPRRSSRVGKPDALCFVTALPFRKREVIERRSLMVVVVLDAVSIRSSVYAPR